jgi:hypothetical protein
MQIGQATAQVAQAYGLAKKAEKKPAAPSKAPTGGTQQAYKLDVRTEALSRLDLVRSRTQSGYYNRPEVLDELANRLMSIL